MDHQFSAAEADRLINGVRVYIYRRPDGTEYESSYDFSMFTSPVSVRYEREWVEQDSEKA